MRKFILVMLLFLTSCNNVPLRAALEPEVPKEGSLMYRQGFKEGCNTGMTVYGNDVVRIKYSTDVSPHLMENKTYRNAWKLGNRYCRFHVSQMQMEGTIMKDFGIPVFPNRMLPNDGSIIRERLTDSFWIDLEVEENAWVHGIDWPFSKIDKDPATFDGRSIGKEGGVFGLLSMN
ncbi:MAG: hypothetical protein COV35_01670 [Alphaproteobacteria bacterium CG11_big_fil_rev_8_21_14_0_20_39_49]|nr:MAG: hypothetical protein COV35_01670 [Alphaproteobacteria bacterium CG11_big_fil_rev_8_21_14_0_20_39_49]